MSRTSLRRILKAIDTQAIAVVVALAGSDLERSIGKRAQSKASNCLAATPLLSQPSKWQR
jgi:hypothetical protein